jgi:hypothetical protein
MVHSHLTMNNILFDLDRQSQIAEFCVNILAELEGKDGGRAEAGDFSGEDWSPRSDVEASTELFSEIVGSDSAAASDVPVFVSQAARTTEAEFPFPPHQRPPRGRHQPRNSPARKDLTNARTLSSDSSSGAISEKPIASSPFSVM